MAMSRDDSELVLVLARRGRRHRRCFDRVLRRAERSAGCDSGDLAASDGANVRRAHGAQQFALRKREALDSDHQTDAGDLHRADRVSSRDEVRRFRVDVENQLPSDDQIVGDGVAGVRAVPGVPDRAASHRLPGEVIKEAYTDTSNRGRVVSALGLDPDVLSCHCFVVISSYMEDRYRRESARYPAEVAIYDDLRAQGTVIDTVAPTAPLSYRWDLLPQWGAASLPFRKLLVGPMITVIKLP